MPEIANQITSKVVRRGRWLSESITFGIRKVGLRLSFGFHRRLHKYDRSIAS